MNDAQKVRLDKWLWAARFFKTRAKAKQAIDGGKIHVEGVRGKAGKELRLGDQLRIRQGWDEKTVIVTGLSDKRRGAPEAQGLYLETKESSELRLRVAAQRQSAGKTGVTGRPSKKNRRLIHQFREKNLD
ncbi:MAG TPA: RNA-binding protein [Gammaproteobacteria bacterium]|jgi:ribosome-associated heat shock protein Hsp15|nr:RNA-binding protein [Gammaproteobacteria bacterium]